jgi:hypothetical protein
VLDLLDEPNENIEDKGGERLHNGRAKNSLERVFDNDCGESLSPLVELTLNLFEEGEGDVRRKERGSLDETILSWPSLPTYEQYVR